MGSSSSGSNLQASFDINLLSPAVILSKRVMVVRYSGIMFDENSVGSGWTWIKFCSVTGFVLAMLGPSFFTLIEPDK